MLVDNGLVLGSPLDSFLPYAYDENMKETYEK